MNPILKNATIVAGTAVAFLAFYYLNNLLFSSLAFSQQANWIFLPSGLRFLIVLIFAEYGALGIAIGAFFIDFNYIRLDDLTLVGSALIHGISPLLSRWICIKTFDLEVNLRHISAVMLLKMTLVFALISPVLHQSWYAFRGYSIDFVKDTLVMGIGDILGVLIVLYVATLTIKLVDFFRS
jgi:hypothetical protein